MNAATKALAFTLHEQPLRLEILRQAVEHPGCGGYVAFEGWVRDHNEGQRVLRLEYEAFEPLACREGERILAEARQRYDIQRAWCAHRVGPLAVGDIAVWVGVSAAHRGECFDACRYIIDQVKHRVPIWKKEHYENGDSGWVNCERCAAEAHAHDAHSHEPHSHSHEAHAHETHAPEGRHSHLHEPHSHEPHAHEAAPPEHASLHT